MKTIDRIKAIIIYYDLSISAFEKKAKLSNNSIQTAIKRNSNVKDSTISSILDTFPQINPAWVLTGEGEMLKENLIYNKLEKKYNELENRILELEKNFEAVIRSIKLINK